MTRLEDAVRDTIEELASEAQGADLGQRALAGARRRSLVVLGARVVAVLVVVAMAVGVAVFIDGRRIDVPPAGSVVWPLPKPLDTKSTGSVLSFYADKNGSNVLDPSTGKYRDAPGRVVDFSPDLRYVVITFEPENPYSGDGSTELGIFDTATGKKLDVVARTPKNTQAEVLWSPDGRWLAIFETISHRQGNGPVEGVSYRLKFLDLQTGNLVAGVLPAVVRARMLGWLSDGSGLVVANTTGQKSEHYIFSRDGSHDGAVEWPAGFLADGHMLPRTNLVVLTKYSGSTTYQQNAVEAIVIDVRGGQTVDNFVPKIPPAKPQSFQMEWLTVNERMLHSSGDVSVFNVRTGEIRRLRVLDQNYGFAARPASGLSPAAQRLVF